MIGTGTVRLIGCHTIWTRIGRVAGGCILTRLGVRNPMCSRAQVPLAVIPPANIPLAVIPLAIIPLAIILLAIILLAIRWRIARRSRRDHRTHRWRPRRSDMRSTTAGGTAPLANIADRTLVGKAFVAQSV